MPARPHGDTTRSSRPAAVVPPRCQRRRPQWWCRCACPLRRCHRNLHSRRGRARDGPSRWHARRSASHCRGGTRSPPRTRHAGTTRSYVQKRKKKNGDQRRGARGGTPPASRVEVRLQRVAGSPSQPTALRAQRQRAHHRRPPPPPATRRTPRRHRLFGTRRGGGAAPPRRRLLAPPSLSPQRKNSRSVDEKYSGGGRVTPPRRRQRARGAPCRRPPHRGRP